MAEKDLGFTTGDALKQSQSLENARVANSKEVLVRKIVAKVKELLQPVYGQSVEASLNAEHLTEIDSVKGEFLGTVSVKASVATEAGTKTIVCPVSVESNSITLPDTQLLVARITETQGSLDTDMEEKLKAIKAKMDTINAEVKMNEEINRRVDAGEDLTTVKAEVMEGRVVEAKKEEKGTTFDFSEGGLDGLKLSDIPQSFMFNKCNLPSSMKEGDLVMVNGVRYKIVGSSTDLAADKAGLQWVMQIHLGE